jgi:hypothetical protein
MVDAIITEVINILGYIFAVVVSRGSYSSSLDGVTIQKRYNMMFIWPKESFRFMWISAHVKLNVKI